MSDVLRAWILDAPASPAEQVRVVIPSWGTEQWGPMPWSPRVDTLGRLVYPSRGDAAVVALDDVRQPIAVIAWGDGAEEGSGPVPGDVPLGTVTWIVLPMAPTGWLIADGSPVTSTYPALRAALIDAGSPFGASGSHPRLPDLVGRFPRGAGIGVTLGATGGADTVTLTVDQLPSHTHTGPSHRHSISDSGTHTHSLRNPATGNAPVWDYVGSGGATRGHYRNPINPTGWSNELYADHGGNHNHGGWTGWEGSGNTGSAGGGQAHENRPPYVNLTPIVRAY